MTSRGSKTKTGKLSELWGFTNAIINIIEHWILVHEKRQVHLSFKQIDQARLLKLRLWRERYCVEIPEILDLILHILRAQVRRPVKPGGLGISVAALLGAGAEKILEQELKKKYPDNENRTVFREQERERQLQLEIDASFDGMMTRERRIKSVLDVVDIGNFASAYANQILKRRTEVQAELFDPARKRKAYRNNCWR